MNVLDRAAYPSVASLLTRSRARGVALVLTLALVVGGCGIFGGGGDTTPPATPGGLEAASADGRIDLQWTTVGDEDLDGYNVYRAQKSLPVDTLSSRSPVNDAPLPEATYSDDSVENGTVYAYRVTAVDEAGNESDPSGEVTVRPFASPPERP